MRICLFINSLRGAAGSERMAVLLANKLADNGYDVHMLTRQGGTMSFFELRTGIKRHCLYEEEGINIYKTYLQGMKRYRRVLKEIQPDYVIDVCVAMSLMTIPATVFNKNIKVISWEHFNANAYFNFFTAKLSKWLASKLAYTIVVLTQADKETYIKKFAPQRVKVIKNPVTIEIAESADLNSKIILAIGRFTAQKGFDMLIESWSLINKTYPDWKLRIVGNGEDEQALLAQCARLNLENSILFTEPIRNVKVYYQNSSIFVMSSRFEGLPLVLIEAKAYGLPIVSFDCETGPREIIRDHIDGVLVPSGDTQKLAEALADLMANEGKRKLLGSNSQQNMNEFSLPAFLNAWEELLHCETLKHT